MDRCKSRWIQLRGKSTAGDGKAVRTRNAESAGPIVWLGKRKKYLSGCCHDKDEGIAQNRSNPAFGAWDMGWNQYAIWSRRRRLLYIYIHIATIHTHIAVIHRHTYCCWDCVSIVKLYIRGELRCTCALFLLVCCTRILRSTISDLKHVHWNMGLLNLPNNLLFELYKFQNYI